MKTALWWTVGKVVVAASHLSGAFLAAQAAAAQPPTITIEGASQVTGTSAIVGWSVNANSLSTSCVFRWGTTTAYDQGSSYFLLAPIDMSLAFSNRLTGLSPSTTYHYQVVATNSAGETVAPDMTFTVQHKFPRSMYRWRV
jgi:hypothetical protein